MDDRGKHLTSKDRILKQFKVRADDWADVVMMRVTGAPSQLHASDARYHKDCLSRFFSQRSVPGDNKEGNKDTVETPQSVRARCELIVPKYGIQWACRNVSQSLWVAA